MDAGRWDRVGEVVEHVAVVVRRGDVYTVPVPLGVTSGQFCGWGSIVGGVEGLLLFVTRVKMFEGKLTANNAPSWNDLVKR